ncbi:MAG: zeta toxin [Bacteroidetes bacterium 4484_276]|nr:MAG: zeta toxin [Bacteroidetes bacterium 4484_276]
MRQLYIIAGSNGAGKTTVSYTILPKILDCKEFINADEIARGLSPFQPEKENINAGRLMLTKIKRLLNAGVDFAFETTLSTRSYVNLIQQAHDKGYFVTLLFFWLNTPDLAVKRVKTRVQEGGHDIPENIIRRRYDSGLRNFFQLYIPISDNWLLIDNSGEPYQVIAEGIKDNTEIINRKIWNNIFKKHYEN